jgi:hypothetical protein
MIIISSVSIISCHNERPLARVQNSALHEQQLHVVAASVVNACHMAGSSGSGSGGGGGGTAVVSTTQWALIKAITTTAAAAAAAAAACACDAAEEEKGVSCGSWYRFVADENVGLLP